MSAIQVFNQLRSECSPVRSIKNVMKISLFATLTTLALLGVHSSNATLLIDTLGLTLNGSGQATSTTYLGQGFNSGSGDLSLNSVTLNIYKSGTIGGTFFVSLYSSSGGVPSSSEYPIASGLSVSGLGTSTGNTVTFPDLSYTLQPDIDYFIVVGASASSSGLFWGRADDTGGLPPRSTSLSSSGPWFNNDPSVQRISVGVVPVPEPGGWLAVSFLAFFATTRLVKGQLRRKNEVKVLQVV